jgi:hypothetical protein
MRAVILFLLLITATARADSLDEVERKELRAYLVDLKAGRPGSAAQVERFAAMPFEGLLETIRAYTQLDGAIEPPTHRAFQTLLERASREALSPWPLLTLYSPDFARFLTTADNPLPRELLRRLLDSGNGRLAFDLCIRLAPVASLEHLAAGKKDRRTELFDAWNRRLALAREARPLPGLDGQLRKIASAFSLDLPDEELEAHLRFLASWPLLRETYLRELGRCLEQERESVVLAGLKVQQRAPALVERNEALIVRWMKAPAVVEAAVRNFAFDEATDRSATLHKLWAKLPVDQVRMRYQALFAMSVHPKGNDDFALSVIRDQAFDLFDPALAVLKRGEPGKAKEAVKLILTKSERGREEALRLARDLKLAGFEEDALAIALEEKNDLILRQTAMLYLEHADGKVRRKLLPCLATPKPDLRLTAIRAFKDKTGLSVDDQREIGPTLIRVAQADPSMGHRQEVMYVLGCWKSPQTMEFFRKLASDNPAVVLSDGYYSDARYWQYRFRLMALLGLARLGDSAAKKELLSLHAKGSPAEKMDVLLAFLDLGEVPEAAFADLDSIEPRLVATAAHLISSHGDKRIKELMKKLFASKPLWQEYRGSGIDDYNILRIVEGK